MQFDESESKFDPALVAGILLCIFAIGLVLAFAVF
jgi:hypothetical protein